MGAEPERERFRVGSIDVEFVAVWPAARVSVGGTDHQADVVALADRLTADDDVGRRLAPVPAVLACPLGYSTAAWARRSSWIS